jgi:hypothetical protein
LINGIGKPKMPFKPSKKAKLSSSFCLNILVKRAKFWECQKSVAFVYICGKQAYSGDKNKKSEIMFPENKQENPTSSENGN